MLHFQTIIKGQPCSPQRYGYNGVIIEKLIRHFDTWHVVRVLIHLKNKYVYFHKYYANTKSYFKKKFFMVVMKNDLSIFDLLNQKLYSRLTDSIF